jgi:hypothetical protein
MASHVPTCAALKAMEKKLSAEVRRARDELIKDQQSCSEMKEWLLVDEHEEVETIEDQVKDVEDFMVDCQDFATFLKSVKTIVANRQTSSDLKKFEAVYKDRMKKHKRRGHFLYPPNHHVFFAYEWEVFGLCFLAMFIAFKLAGFAHIVSCFILLVALTIFYECLCIEARRKLGMKISEGHGAVDTVPMPTMWKFVRGLMIVRLVTDAFLYLCYASLVIMVDEESAEQVIHVCTIGAYASMVAFMFFLLLLAIAGLLVLVELPKSMEQVFMFIQFHILQLFGYWDKAMYLINEAEGDINYIKVHVGVAVEDTKNIINMVTNVLSAIKAPIDAAEGVCKKVGNAIANAGKSVWHGICSIF